MSEEIKIEKNEEKCFCKSELFQRTLAVAIGSFIGVYLALSLFCAMHKPPMMHHGFHHRHFGAMQTRPLPPGFPEKFKNHDFKNQVQKPDKEFEVK